MSIEVKPLDEQQPAGDVKPGWMREASVSKLKAERVQDLLQVGWRLTEDETALRRVRVFPASQVAREYANYVSALSVALGLPAQVRLAGKRCDVILRVAASPAPADLEDAVIRLAAQLG